ncbi:phage/plasmid primase, P4 family [Sorangium sp. So ce134]
MTNVRFARGDHAELAKAVLHALGPAPLTYDAGEFWRYSAARGVWELVPSHVVRHTAAQFAGAPVGQDEKPLKVNVADVRGAEAIARDELLSQAGRVTFSGAPPGAAFRNGFVVVRDGRIDVVPHSEAHRARHGYPMDYVAWSPGRTPLLNEFLEGVFADCGEEEAAARTALLQEFVGACLIGDAVSYQRCLILYGEGGNGKSAVINLVRAMFPPEGLASLPPQRWTERFALSALEGKLANFVSETPTGEILDGGAFKAVVTGDPVMAERKHRDPFEFRPVAGHMFSTNWPIAASDFSAGFWRRPMILPFTRRFDTAHERKIAPEARVIDQELSGVVSWALEGAARLQRQKQYTMSSQSLVLANEWRDSSDQVRLFLATRPADEVIQASEFYRQYRAWAGENGHKNVLSAHMFGRRVVASKLYERDEDERARFYRRVVAGKLLS